MRPAVVRCESTGDEPAAWLLYIFKLLHGARAGDLTIEQRTHFEFLVKLNTAKAIGIKIAQGVLLRADEVVE